MDTPKTEMELIATFLLRAESYGFDLVKLGTRYPDAIIRKDEQEYKVEFEYASANFWQHNHDPSKCDLIICWIDNDECPVLPILALSNPDWYRQEITLVDPVQKTARYWKARALDAEEKLSKEDRELKQRMTDLISKKRRLRLEEMRAKENQILESRRKDLEFITLIKRGDISINDACLQVYGSECIDSLDRKVSKLLNTVNLADVELRTIEQEIGNERYMRLHGEASFDLPAQKKALRKNKTRSQKKTVFKLTEKDLVFLRLHLEEGVPKTKAFEQAYGYRYAGSHVGKVEVLLAVIKLHGDVTDDFIAERDWQELLEAEKEQKKKVRMEKDLTFLRLYREEGLSKAKAFEQAYGLRYAGNHVHRIRRLLETHGFPASI